MFRVWVTDLDSPSYIVATAAVELGYFAREGIEAEVVTKLDNIGDRIRSGDISFIAGSAFNATYGFPDWKGAKILCALAQYAYWFLAVRADLAVTRGDLAALKGRTIFASSGFPGIALKHMLAEAGFDLARGDVRVLANPRPSGGKVWMGHSGMQAIAQGADGFWGNGMRVAVAERAGVAKTHLDIRRGDGPPGARHYNFPALSTSDRLIAERPDVVGGAMRAIARVQQDLKKDPSLAVDVGRRLFPPDEAALIGELVARDAPFYDSAISHEAVNGLMDIGMKQKVISAPVAYGDLVASSFSHLWK